MKAFRPYDPIWICALQAFLQAAQQSIVQYAQQAAEKALKDQAPLVRADVAMCGSRWRKSA